MKRFFCFLICFCFLFAGCRKVNTDETIQTTAPVVATVTEPAVILPQQEAMYAVSVPTNTETTRAEDGTVIFSHTHQGISLTLPEPEVAEKVKADFRSRIDKGAETANKLLSAAMADYNNSENWTPYLYNITYSPMRMDQGVLSLYGNCITYSGASHPDRLSTSANYDLVTGDILTLGSIMSAEATPEDFCELVLNKLNEIKDEKYLIEGYEETVKQRFSKDESLNQDWYFSTDGLCFYFAPYVIAPYSSGVIVAEIPYAELTGLLYDGYFPAERENAAGTIQITTLDETDTTQFTQIAELILDTDGEMVFLHIDGIVWDVKIEYGAWDTANTTFSPVYTALFSGSLSPGDAIMLQTNEFASLRLTYSNGEDTIIQHFTQTEDGIDLALNGYIAPL